MKFMRMLILPLAILLAAGALAACGDDSGGGPTVTEAWARTTAPGQPTGAIYAQIAGGDADDRLVAASVPADVAARVELHESMESHEAADESADMGDDHGEGSMDEGHDDEAHSDDAHSTGGMSMREVDAVEVPAGDTITLEPGGLHVMLLDLAGPIEEGQAIPLTLTFEQAGEIRVDATARDH